MLPYLDKFIESGIESLKIEGRMKSIHYVATVTKAYRRAVDSIIKGENSEILIKELMAELNGIGERDYTTGFYLDEKDDDMMQYHPHNVIKNIKFVGKILEVDKDKGLIKIEQRNKFVVGDELEILQPKGANSSFTVEGIINADGFEVTSAPHPREILYLKGSTMNVLSGSLLRIRSKND